MVWIYWRMVSRAHMTLLHPLSSPLPSSLNHRHRILFLVELQTPISYAHSRLEQQLRMTASVDGC